MTTERDWVIRAAVPEDENCVVPLWLHQLCRGNDARVYGYTSAPRKGSSDHVAWWKINQPIVTALFHSAVVRVACDPTRASYTPGYPSVIWAWSVSSDDYVFGAGVKRSVTRVSTDMAKEIATDLLRDEMGREMRTAFDLVELQEMALVPENWNRSAGWASSLRQMAVGGRDRLYMSAARNVLDPNRKPWLTCAERLHACSVCGRSA